MKKVIFFDCFGVIVSEVAVAWFNKHYNKEDALRLKDEIFVPADNGELTEDEAYELMGKGIGVSYLQVKKDWYDDIKINEELVEYIKELGTKYDVYLLSNAISSFVRNILEEHNLSGLFKNIYVSSEIKHIKPNKDYFEYVLNDLHLNPNQCVMIDDNPSNIQTALDLGLNGIVFKDNKQFKTELNEFLK